MIVLVPLILIPIVAWLTARWPVERTSRLDRILASARTPMLLGTVSALGLWWTWGSLNPVEVVHDETAYSFIVKTDFAGRLYG